MEMYLAAVVGVGRVMHSGQFEREQSPYNGRYQVAVGKAPNPMWVALLPIRSRLMYSVLLSALLATLNRSRQKPCEKKKSV
jgi:hypothetical protein